MASRRKGGTPSPRCCHDERVGGADLAGQGFDETALGVHALQGAVLVGDGHAEAPEVEPGPSEDVIQELVEFRFPTLDQQRQVEAVHACIGEAGVVDGGTERVADRVGDHAEQLRLVVDGVVAVQPFQSVEGQLPGRRGGLIAQTRKRHETTQLRREDAADQARRPHGQHDTIGAIRVAQPAWRGRPALVSRGHPGLVFQGRDALATPGCRICLVQQIERLEAVIDVVGRVDQLGNRSGASLNDLTIEPPEIRESTLEIVGRQNQPGPGLSGQGRPDSWPHRGLEEVRIFQIDVIRPCLDRGQQDFGPQRLGVVPRAPFPRVATGHNHRHRRGNCSPSLGHQGDYRIPAEALKVVSPQLQHPGSGRDRRRDLPFSLVQAHCRDGNCQVRHGSPDI